MIKFVEQTYKTEIAINPFHVVYVWTDGSNTTQITTTTGVYRVADNMDSVIVRINQWFRNTGDLGRWRY